MTREEAIRHIGDVINIENNSIKPIVIFEQEKEALYIAIEALQNLSKPNNELKGSDLISRGDAVALVIKAIHGTDNEEIKEYLFDGLRKQMWSLPSAESTGAMDEAIQEYIKDGYMQPIGEDLISRQDAIEAFYEPKNGGTYAELDDGSEWYMTSKQIYAVLESLPSAEAEEYEDYEHATLVDIKAPLRASAETVHGKWMEIEDYNGDIHYQCDQCGNEFILIDGTPKDNNYHFCPNCGARMYKGGAE